MKIVWSPLAVERVSEIAEYISRDNPDAAVVWVNSLFKRIGLIKDFTRSGRKVPGINRDEIRELVYGDYRVIYRIESTRVAIITVRHLRQALSKEDIER